MGFRVSATYTSTGQAAAIVARVAEAAAEACNDWANAVLEEAKTIVPVRTGELRDSGHLETAADSGAVTTQVVFDAPYAVYVEFGTGVRGAASPGAGPGPYDPNWPGMVAQPYIRPAFDGLRDDAEPMVEKAVRDAI